MLMIRELMLFWPTDTFSYCPSQFLHVQPEFLVEIRAFQNALLIRNRSRVLFRNLGFCEILQFLSIRCVEFQFNVEQLNVGFRWCFIDVFWSLTIKLGLNRRVSKLVLIEVHSQFFWSIETTIKQQFDMPVMVDQRRQCQVDSITAIFSIRLHDLRCSVRDWMQLQKINEVGFESPCWNLADCLPFQFCLKKLLGFYTM